MSGLDICGSLCDLWKPPPTFFLANIFRWNPIVSGFQRGMFANGSLWTNLCCREGKRKANIIFLPRCCLAPCYESNHNHRSRFILSQRCFSSSCQPRKVIYQMSTSPILKVLNAIYCIQTVLTITNSIRAPAVLTNFAIEPLFFGSLAKHGLVLQRQSLKLSFKSESSHMIWRRRL